jgi:subtilisin-like proprotein convertase family protein
MLKQPLRDVMTRWALRLRRPPGRRLTFVARRAPIITVAVPRLEEMEIRLAPAALIAPTAADPTAVNGITSGNLVFNSFAGNQTAADFSSPTVVADPLSALNQVMVTQSRRASDGLLDLVGQYSSNGGATWSSLGGLAPRLSSPTTFGDGSGNNNYPNASQPSLAFGRDGTFYVTYTQHTNDYSNGVLVVQSYNFSTGGPATRPINPTGGQGYGSSTQRVLYRWSNGLDAAYNPTVALDNNLPNYTDADTGLNFRDTLVDPNTGRPKAIYVAWNTVAAVPSGNDFPNNSGVLFNPNAVWTSVSTDAGFNFSSPVAVNGSSIALGSPGSTGLLLGPRAGYLAVDSRTNTGGGAPVIGFSPGTSAAPGRAVVGWTGGVSTTPGATGSLNYDITQPDGGLTASNVGSIRTFMRTDSVDITDAAEAVSPATFDTAAKTDYAINITAADLNGLTLTDLISNLTVTTAFAHTNVGQLRLELIGPGGITVRLFNNRILGDGSTPNAGGVFNQPPGLPSSPGATNNNQTYGLGRSANLNNGTNFGTTFDDYAARRITDPKNAFPYIGSYKADSWNSSTGALSQFSGMSINSLVGTWTLRITDVRADRITAPPFPQKFINYFALNVTASAQGNQALVPGMAADSKVQSLDANGNQIDLQLPAVNAAPLVGLTTLPANPTGVGPSLSIAFDTTIQPYNNLTSLRQSANSPFVSPPGTLLFLYTTPGFDINLSRGVLSPTVNGATANFFYGDTGKQTVTRVNDDSASDNFSEGNRPQFTPSLAVDSQTGEIAVMWYDARYDASQTRVATYLAVSSDGGKTFNQSADDNFTTPGKQIYLNRSRTATDAIAYAASGGNASRSTVTIEPVPTIISAIPGNLGVGQRQSLLAVGAGKFTGYWAGNQNLPSQTAADTPNPPLNFTGSTIFRSAVTATSGPRIVYGDQGPLESNTLDSIFVIFDRPVDVATFAAGDIVIQFRSPYDPITQAATVLQPGVDYGTPAPVNVGGVNARAATTFRVPFLRPQTAIGTYSYIVGPAINDLVRVAGATGTFTNNATVYPTPPATVTSTQTPTSIPPGSYSATPTPTITSRTTDYPVTVTDPGGGLLVRTPRVDLNLDKPAGPNVGDGGSLTDLTVQLISPDGRIVTLFDGTLRGFAGNTINAQYRAPADGGTAQPAAGNVTGTVTPDGNFTSYRGAPIGGTWILRITNRVAADQPVGPAPAGTLNAWGLSFTTVTRDVSVRLGNTMDQNDDGFSGDINGNVSGIPNRYDVFAAPRPDAALGNTTPFTFPYDSLSSPLIIIGPRYVVPDAERLTLNDAVRFVDVSFTRPMDASTFEADGRDVLRILGPSGTIFDKVLYDTQFPGKAYPVSVAPLDGAGNPSTIAATPTATTFRVSFPTQVLTGNYNVEFGPDIRDTQGNALDNNRNAGLAVLRGGDPTTGVINPTSFNSTGPVTIQPGQTVVSQVFINDLFTVQQTLAQRIRIRVDISYPNDPDLVGDLVAPDGTTIRLFSNVGTAGTARANFTNTTFDDGGTTPIQVGLAPFNAGPYNPQFPLSAFRGRASTVIDPVTGLVTPWTLRITNTGNSVGTINSFTLTLPKTVPGTGLGEPIDDRFTVPFRIFTQDATNPLTKQVWTPVGPAPENGGVNPTTGDNASRITGVAVDPSDASGNTVYAGGASGGIWKSTNFLTASALGPNWVPLTDFGPTDALDTGSITVFPRNGDPNQSIIFALTGEGDTGSRGVGVLRSLDGGRNWVVLDSLTNSDSSGNILPIDSPLRDRRFFGSTGFKIIVDPTATPTGDVIVYAAVSGNNGGVYRSTDTGRHWQLVRGGNATDVFLAAGSRSTSTFSSGALEFLYAAFAGDGVYTTPQATSATAMTLAGGGGGTPLIRNIDPTPDVAVTVASPAGTPNGPKGRIQIAGPAATGDVLADTFYAGWLYAIVATPDGKRDGLYMTKDFGTNWVKVHTPVFIPNPANKSTGFPTNNETRPDQDIFNPPSLPNGQGNYDINIAVDPLNPEVVYVGGLGAGNGVPFPASGLIRVDVTAINDSQAFTTFDNSSATQAGTQYTTVGGITTTASGAAIDKTKVVGSGTPNGNVFNLSRNPDAPFLSNASVRVTKAAQFTNNGENASYSGFIAFSSTADTHRLIAVRDQLTGKTRLIVTGDQQIASGVDDGSGNLVRDFAPFANTQTTLSVFGSRNGNLQIFQAYSGAAQPSQLAADLAQAFFYGMGQDNGFPVSSGNVLATGNLSWTGPAGDGAGVAVDQTGSGTAYQYRWPCCNGGAGLASDFFRVILPPGPGGSAGVSRTNGLLQAGDDPAANQGQWPEIDARVGYFTVNPIDPNGIAISSLVGRIFRTTNKGVNWFPIGEPGQLDGSVGHAIAFGAPDPAAPGQLNNYLLVGTDNGNVFVTFTGGAPWTNISQGIAGNGGIKQIVTNPQRGSHDAYAVADNGVFYLADSRVPGGQWVNITGVGQSATSGNLFNLRTPIFNDANSDATNKLPNSVVPFDVRNLTSIVADWRYAIPTDPAFPTKNTFPILYVGGNGGVYRSLDRGATWQVYPDAQTLLDPATGLPLVDAITGLPVVSPRGGYLPNVDVRDLDLSLGNIDPLTGFPKQSSGGFNMLTASTYGRGMFAIRLEDPPSVSQYNVLAQSGPRVVGLAASTQSSLRVRFDAAVLPSSFTAADVVLRNAAGTVIAVTSVTPIANFVGGVDQRNLFQINFAPVNLTDTYRVAIGQNIFDYAGFGMNQNGDKINGDATINPDTGFSVDAYVGNFVTIAGAQKGALFINEQPSARAGDPVAVTVTATGADGNALPNFNGVVTFASSDMKISRGAGLPNDSNLDNGSKTFAVTYKTSTFSPPLPPTTLTVTDTSGQLGSATASIVVRGGAAATFDVTGIASPTKAGTLNNVSLTARDAFGNVADAFTGQVSFSSSDPLVLPANGLPDVFTFTAANQGQATIFQQVALKTAGFQSVTARDVLSGNVVGSQVGILVTPEVAASLRVTGHATPIVAGTFSDFRVSAFDKYGNVASGYTGTVHLSSSDKQVAAGNGLPADYTFGAAEFGSHLFQLGSQLKTAGIQSVTATDAATAKIAGTQPNIFVVAAAASKFAIAGHPSPVVAASQNGFTVFATDAFGNRSNNYTGTVSFSSTDPLAVPGNGLPNPYTFVAADAGTHTFPNGATLRTAGTQSIFVTDLATGFAGSQDGIVVLPSAGATLQLSGFPNPATAGVAGDITVTARDPFGNQAFGYTGTVRFTSTDKQVGVGNGLPANYTFTAADGGRHTFTGATLRTAGLQAITATDTATGTIAGTQDGILVTAAPASSLAVTGYPSPVVAGSANAFTVTARDVFGNLATNYAGTVLFTSTDTQVGPNKGLPLSYAFTPADAGKHTFGASLRTAGTQSLTATDILSPALTGSQAGISVVAGLLSRLTVGGYPSPVVAGLDTGLTVAAADAFGNPVAGFVGTVQFTTSDPQGTVPAAYAFTAADNGRKTFAGGFALRTAGLQSVTGTVVGASNLTATQSGIAVIPAAATTFKLDGFPTTISALVPATFTVTAYDPFGNVATGFTGPANVSTSDPRAKVDNPIAVTNGVGTGSVTFRTTGTQSVTVTDATTGGVVGTAGGLNVGAAPPDVVVPGAVAALSLSDLTAVGTDAGTPSLVSVLNRDGSLKYQFAPYGPEYTGGVRVALQRTPAGPRVVVAPGPGTPPEVRIFDPATGQVVQTIMAFEATFTGGVFVATGDINTDGYDDVILSPDNGGGPRVRVLDGRTLGTLADFFGIDDPNFRGGVRATLTDINGDGTNDLIVAAGFGGGPRVAIFDGKSVLTGSQTPARMVADFFAFEPELRNGAYVSGGDVDGDGFGDLAFGAGPGGGPRVRVVNGLQILLASPFPNLDLVPQAQIGNFFAGSAEATGGVRVTMKQLAPDNPDGTLPPAAIVTGSGSLNTLVTSYTANQILSNVIPDSLWTFEGLAGATNGVFVG